MLRKKEKRTARKLQFETLEDRRVLSQLGVPALHLSFGGRAKINDLSLQKADVATFDGSSAKKLLDGNDLGIGRLPVDALAVLDDGLILSFSRPGSVPGIAGRVDDSDLVKYSTVTDTFTMYLDGSDVGLTRSSEDIDAVDILPSGQIVVSTTGRFSVPGATGNSRDLVIFTPDQLGKDTSGDWAVYLAGQDIGLNRSSENIDALAIDGDTVYVSTTGKLSAGGVAAADEDVVAFKEGKGSIVLRGQDFGLSRYDIKSLDLPSEKAVSDLHPVTLTLSMFAIPTTLNVPVVEVASFVASQSLPDPVIPSMGAVEAASFAERTARGISSTDTIARCGLTYEDLVRHVDVYAGPGQYFVEYSNGAVELRVIPDGLPAGQDHPFVWEVTPILRNTPDLGKVPKPVKDTGATFYDDTRGIDVHAKEGYYLIQYKDGTVEERPRPEGGYIPRPEDLTLGGADNSKPKSAFGPSPQVLGLSTDGSSPKPSSELWYIGTSYMSSSGELRVATPGNSFFQDPVTKTILLRSIKDSGVAMEKIKAPTATVVTHSTQSVRDLFFEAYGRDPTSEEARYWEMRTDKKGDALLGAMQYAHQHGVDKTITTSFEPVVLTAKTVDQALTELGQITVTSGAKNTVALDWDWSIDDPSLFVSKEQQDALSGAEIWSMWWENVIWAPPEAMDNKTLQFYMDSPDYVVNFDEQTPAQVNAIHPGGVTSVRIRRVGCISGAQVILDANGTVLPGAGSYDLISPQAIDTRLGLITVIGHAATDVSSWLGTEMTTRVNNSVNEAISSLVLFWNQN